MTAPYNLSFQTSQLYPQPIGSNLVVIMSIDLDNCFTVAETDRLLKTRPLHTNQTLFFVTPNFLLNEYPDLLSTSPYIDGLSIILLTWSPFPTTLPDLEPEGDNAFKVTGSLTPYNLPFPSAGEGSKFHAPQDDPERTSWPILEVADFCFDP